MPGHPKDRDTKEEGGQATPATPQPPAEKKPAEKESEKTAPEKKETGEEEKFHRH